MNVSASQFQEIIRHIGCMGMYQFTQVWGEDAEYLYQKLHKEFNGNVAKFVSYLDGNNIQVLWRYMATHLDRVKREGA